MELIDRYDAQEQTAEEGNKRKQGRGKRFWWWMESTFKKKRENFINIKNKENFILKNSKMNRNKFKKQTNFNET